MKTKILLFCLLLAQFAAFHAYSQAPTKVWDKTLGGSGSDNATSIIATSDGGYVVGGTSNSGISGDKSEANKGGDDYWIVKINSTGQKVWDKTFGGNNIDVLNDIIATNDGGFVLVGKSLSGISGDKTEASMGNYDYWIVKINSVGQKVWDKTIGGSNEDAATSIVESADGSFVVAGYSNSNISGDKSEASKGNLDIWIVKINSTGQKVWDKTLGGSLDDLTLSMIASSDGGFVISGNSDSGISGDKTEASKGLNDYWIVKINNAGQKVWDKTLGGNSYDYAYSKSIVETSDGGFVISGISVSGISGDKSEANKDNFYDYWIIKINSMGQKVWDKTLGGTSTEFYPSIIKTSDGGFVLGGSSSSGISGDKSEASKGEMDYWIVKINSIGQNVWDKTIGGNSFDYALSISSTSDGGYLVAGYSGSNNTGDKSEASKGGNDYWVVKLQEPCTTFTNNIAYVNTNATGANTGVNWANAFTSLESALIAARACGVTQIWVAKGTYKPSADPFGNMTNPTDPRDKTFYLKDGVAIYGGFAGTESAINQRVPSNITVFDGDIGTIGSNTDNCYHVVLSVSDGSNTILDGITITNGNANDLNGDVIFVETQAIVRLFGGGMFNINSSPSLKNVSFITNNATLGGGIYSNSGSSLNITNAIFSANAASQRGGGIENEFSQLNLTNVVFTKNSAGVFGGGIENNATAGFNAGINSSNLSNISISYLSNLTNVTFSENVAGTEGGGIYQSNYITTIKNGIFWGNTGGVAADIKNQASASVTASYTSMQLSTCL